MIDRNRCNIYKNEQDMKNDQTLQEIIIDAIKNLQQKKLTLENVIDYIDYRYKIRYSKNEIIEVLLLTIKNDIKL